MRDDLDRTPLILATMGGHGEVVNFLLSKGGEKIQLVYYFSCVLLSAGCSDTNYLK